MGSRSVILALALGGLVAGLVLWLERPQPENGSAAIPSAAESESKAKAPSLTQASTVTGTATPRKISPPSPTERSDSQTASPTVSGFSKDESLFSWAGNFWEQVIESSPEEYPLRLREAQTGDAESAFWVFLLLMHCNGQPRAEWQLEHHLQRAQRNLEQMLENNPDSVGDWAWQQEEELKKAYALCSALDPEIELGEPALEWLEIAADGGHLPAMALYHDQARNLLSGNDASLAFRQPGRIEDYKSRADRYARALLRSGHPQSLILMAQMLYVGDVYPRDAMMAYAYAHAAELDGAESLQQMSTSLQQSLEWWLPPEQLEEAKKRARDLGVR